MFIGQGFYCQQLAAFSNNITTSKKRLYSCLLAPENYASMALGLQVGKKYTREKLLSSLVGVQYERKDRDFSRGFF